MSPFMRLSGKCVSGFCRLYSEVATQSFATMSTNVRQLLCDKHIGFLGSGQMAQAMMKGFLLSGTLKGSQVTATDRFGTTFPDAAQFGIEYLQSNDVMAKKSDIIFACVKPDVILSTLSEISSFLAEKLIISVAAGVTLEKLRQVVPQSCRLIRIMPNTPCLVQAGTAVYSLASNVLEEDIEVVKCLCSSIFKVFEEIPESLINAASGISGCGPAYIFLVTEALADGGVRMGIPRLLAHKLAVSMIAGAAAMMEQTEADPAKLKNDVCSPGGATIAAIHALEEGGVRAAFMNAVHAATKRSELINE